MTRYKKIIIGIASFILLLIVANFGITFWVNKKLPKIITENNNTPYYITYKNIDMSLWSGSIKASGIIVVPKTAVNDIVNKAGIYAKIESIAVERFKIWDVLFNDKIKAKSITINKPAVLFYKKDKKEVKSSQSIRSEILDPLQKIIIVSEIYLNRGNLKIIDVKNNQPILSTENINIQLKGIVITDETLKNKIPFLFQQYDITCDSIYYSINEFYRFETNNFKTTNTFLKVKKWALTSKYTRKEFVGKLKKEKDLYTINADSLTIKNMDWGFKNEKLFFNADAITLDKMSANIYRSKLPEDDLSKKYLYNKLFRDLKFSLKVDTLSLHNSLVIYEEEIDVEKGAGKLSLHDFDMNATHIQSGYGQQKMRDIKIKINCKFMNASPLKVNWSLNVLDKTDGFNINGSILNFNTTELFPFAKSYLNASFSGVFDKLYFNFTGNDKNVHGDFSLNYRDLNVNLYKKHEPDKKSKIKSAIANLLVKKDSDGKTKNAKVELERIPEKSFYNFFWRSIAEGMKKILV